MRIFVTGSAGFIGYHLSKQLLEHGHQVFGYDGITPYYDQQLKRDRHANLACYPKFVAKVAMLENDAALRFEILRAQPDVIVHLAAQAGVRYSLENPRAYIDANLIGTFNVMEIARQIGVSHLMIASTSSVYGNNSKLPFREDDPTDTSLTLYAATKKSCETMAHAYANLWNLPTTIFRFFSVYGPWGRPDMALFKFTESMLAGQPIDLFNHGQMRRDFTYVDDIVTAIRLLSIVPPNTLAGVPFQVVNIGNSSAVALLDFVAEIERALGVKAIRNNLPMQAGDVPATWADTSKLKMLTGFQPNTPYRDGIHNFVAWYRDYYNPIILKTGT